MTVTPPPRRALFGTIAALLLIASAPALAAMTTSGPGKVVFYATGSPGFLDIEGATSDIAASDDGTNLRFTVRLDTITTGIELRDTHMREKFMQTVQFPTADLVVPRAAIAWPSDTGSAVTGTIDAPFTAHGVTQSVHVEYTVRKSKTGWRVSAKFPFDISRHGIEVPSYLGVTVAPTMRAEVLFDLVDR